MHKSTVICRLMRLVEASKVMFIITKSEHLLDINQSNMAHGFVKKGESMRLSTMLLGLKVSIVK